MNEILTRRGFIKDAAIAGAGLTALGLPRILRAEDEEVPPIIENVFSKEKGKLGSVVVASDAVNDETGKTHAILSLYSYPHRIDRVDFDPDLNKYIVISNTEPVPVLAARSIIGFANSNLPGNEKIIVGGFNEDRNATVAVSSDSGKSFEAKSVEDQYGNPISGKVSEIKRIHRTDYALLRITDIFGEGSQYALYNSDETNRLQLLSSASDDLPLPLLDNVSQSNDLSTVYVTGRMEAGIADVELDIADAFILGGSYRLEQLKNLDDVFTVRDETGRIEETHILQKFYPRPRIPERFIYKISAGDEEHPIKQSYSYLDDLIRQQLSETFGWEEYFMQRGVSTALLNNIHVFPDGKVWVTGEHGSVDFLPSIPLAMYFETGDEYIIKSGTEKLFPFGELKTVPSDIIDEPNFVMFRGKSKFSRNTETVNGIHVAIGASVGALIRTDANWTPLEETNPWYQIPSASQK
ncbi:MAG: twin-arginine translocation signal domain-containing protein [Candidatus Levybacteria bacterium]|nr:twin-arginine translocation signal domain-containing protein [Candidatus Levybacteria bacterium]